jgi:creatinine amidohydrolase
MVVLDTTTTCPDLERSGVRTALLPIGSIEQHGRSLPLATDWLMADGVAREVAKHLGDVYVLPALPFSCAHIHAGFKGSVSLEFDTFSRVLKDLCTSLFDNGFPRVVLLNVHGGNVNLRTIVREINYARSDAKVVLVSPLLAQPELGAVFESKGEVHAGEFEVALLLAIAPDVVRDPTPADDFMPEVKHEYMDYRFLRDVSPTGVWGYPSRGTREKGERALAAIGLRLAAHIEATFARLGLG